MKKTILSLILLSLTNQSLAQDFYSTAKDGADLKVLSELVAEKCNIEFEQVEQLHSDDRGDEVENFFSLADSHSYNLSEESKALLIQIKTRTNDTRDHGVLIESINDIEVDEEIGLLIELGNNADGTAMIACLKDDSYDIRARQMLIGGGRFLEWLTTKVYKSAGHSPRIKVYTFK